MPTLDDDGLDPQTRQRIRTRALARGTSLRRRRTVVRRSVIVTSLVVVACGGIVLAQTDQQATKTGEHLPVSASTTTASGVTSTIPGATSTTVPGATTTTTPGATSTTVPGATTTTVPGGTTTTTPGTGTTTPAPASTTTAPVNTTIPANTSFSQTLNVTVAPGTTSTKRWTVPPSQSVEASELTLAYSGSNLQGEIRVELQAGSTTQNLLVLDPPQLAAGPFTASLATPLVLPTKDKIELGLTCSSGGSACSSSLTISGTIVPAATKTDDSFDSIEDVVSPGTSSVETWTVPSADTYSLTDLVMSEIESNPGGQQAGQKGEVRFELTPPGGSTRTIFVSSIAKLGEAPTDESFANPIALSANDVLALEVTCGADQAVCEANALFSGHLTPTGT